MMANEQTGRKKVSRRELLRQAACAGALVPWPTASLWSAGRFAAVADTPKAAPGAGSSPFYQVDEALLEAVEEADYKFFWEQANPYTGIVRDRCNATNPDKADLGSIAATGFGLTALCIGAPR